MHFWIHITLWTCSRLSSTVALHLDPINSLVHFIHVSYLALLRVTLHWKQELTSKPSWAILWTTELVEPTPQVHKVAGSKQATRASNDCTIVQHRCLLRHRPCNTCATMYMLGPSHCFKLLHHRSIVRVSFRGRGIHPPCHNLAPLEVRQLVCRAH